MTTSATTTTTGLIFRLRRKRHWLVKRCPDPMWKAGLSRFQSLVACIIATIWPPESHLEHLRTRLKMNFGRSVPGERLRASHHRNRVGPQQRNALSHRTKPRSKLPPSARIMPLLYPDGILARHRMVLDAVGWGIGGEGGIRTPDSLATMSDFEPGAFNRALPPLRFVTPCLSN